jgi:hypothetical protein
MAYCEDAPCCGCCGPNGDGGDSFAQEELYAEFAESFGDDYDDYDDYDDGDGMTDAEGDADTFASAGWGMDEDYGDYGGGFYNDF